MAFINVNKDDQVVLDDNIRESFGSAIAVAETALARVRKIVNDNGRSEVNAALGTEDVTKLETIYNAFKTAVETGKGVSLPGLPAS